MTLTATTPRPRSSVQALANTIVDSDVTRPIVRGYDIQCLSSAQIRLQKGAAHGVSHEPPDPHRPPDGGRRRLHSTPHEGPPRCVGVSYDGPTLKRSPRALT